MNIYEIAALADVSVSTVSKVINGKSEISETTRNHVLQIMKDNNYQPKISTNTPNNIAVFFRPTQGNPFQSPYIEELLRGLSDYFFSRDYNLLVLSSEKIPLDKKDFQVFCHKQRIAACVFLTLTTDDNYIEQIAGPVPIAVINADFSGENLFSVMSDDYAGALQAAEFLFSMGHRRIAYCVSELRFLSHQMRMKAYRQTLEKHGVPFDERLVYSCLISEKDFCTTFENWERQGITPTAIMAVDDMEALKMMSYLKSMGKKIPQDVSIIGFDNYSFVEHLSPPLTTVRQPIYDVSRQAAAVLFSCISGSGSNLQRKFMLSGSLVVRRSVADIRGTDGKEDTAG